MPSAERIAAVVLAGGTSRRFGSDKLIHPIDGRPLLDHALSGLGDDVEIYLVGPARATERPVITVREEPPGGGPTAGLIVGLVTALTGDAELIVVLPGDTPRAGAAAMTMLDRLQDGRSVAALIGIDPSGREQPLQLGLRRAAAEQLIALAGPTAGAGASARKLVARLDPPAHPFPLAAADTFDIDDHDQLAAWPAVATEASGDVS